MSTGFILIYHFCANFTKWSNTHKQFFGNLPTNCLSVFEHFVGLALEELSYDMLLHSLAVISNLSKYTFFDIEVIYL